MEKQTIFNAFRELGTKMLAMSDDEIARYLATNDPIFYRVKNKGERGFRIEARASFHEDVGGY